MKRSAGVKDRELREHVLYLLGGGGAHLSFDSALARFPVACRGVQPSGLPHSAWSLLEHMRIAQWDILEFSRNPEHISPEFPAGLWPASATPPNSRAWAASVQAFQSDLKSMMELVARPSTDLLARIPHGDGQTILREALLAADHNSYHLGQLVLVRKVLRCWPEKGSGAA